MNQSEHIREQGFTYVEVIIAMFIIFLSSSVLWNGVNIALNVVDKSYLTARVNIEIRDLEYHFRRMVNSAEFDYWENEPCRDLFVFTHASDQMTFKYKKESLIYEHLEFSSIVYHENGAVLALKTDRGENVEIKAQWGSFIIGDNP